MSLGMLIYVLCCAVFGWSVISMAVCAVINRRPMVYSNWRELVWPPAYRSWRRRYIAAHPWLLDFYPEKKADV